MLDGRLVPQYLCPMLLSPGLWLYPLFASLFALRGRLAIFRYFLLQFAGYLFPLPAIPASIFCILPPPQYLAGKPLLLTSLSPRAPPSSCVF